MPRAVLSPHTTLHPIVSVAHETPKLGNIRSRAWRNGAGDGDCVHLVVVNSVQEGALPSPAHFTLDVEGLTAAEIAGGATPTWGPGCVVNFTQPPMQAFMCRNVGLTADGSGVAQLSDYIGVTETTIYKIGCPLPAAVAANYVSDPGFEGGSLSHPQPGPAGIPGYNLDNHQAYWNIVALDVDGVPNGRSFDDGSWLRMDATAPHTGRGCARVFLPTGMPTRVWVPCERGDEHFTHEAKADKVCKGGMINALNETGYAISVWARASREGASVRVVVGSKSTSPAGIAVGKPLVLSRAWAQLNVTLPAGVQQAGTAVQLELVGWAPGERATTIWLDDALVLVNATVVDQMGAAANDMA